MAIGKRIKSMASAFYGRAAAYHLALDPDADPAALGLNVAAAAVEAEPLESALRRNLFGTVRPTDDQVAAMAAYVRRAAAALESQHAKDFAAGRVLFPDPASGE